VKLSTAVAVLLVTMWLALICALAGADTQVLGPGGSGFCRATPRGELWGIPNRSLLVCRYNGVDETGDGVPEVVENVLYLNPRGDVDCGRSVVNILDVTRPRQQLIRWYPAC
jgi:hypothetical protein